MDNKNNQTDDQQEINKFSEMASEWWNPNGKFSPLHKFNHVSQEYFVDKIKNHFSILPNGSYPFKKLSLLDVGCGGGLIAEPMTRLGAKVTGIDASEKNINVAKFHAEQMNLKINYLCATPENLNEQFDVILCLEIIEHVADVDLFIKSCAKLLKKDGIIFFATLNRTAKSFLFAIVGAEYILNWLPKGTHDWNKFLKPSEIIGTASKYQLTLKETVGFKFNIFLREWQKSKDTDVNYAVSFKKN
ncbi:MAG: bifunctional 2-polyprenyl-6-hydroxyphenol methylase/3-demethylubiquinol 3-O-methyltransferase UbiG [Candidatus Fonsibacter lacus]